VTSSITVFLALLWEKFSVYDQFVITGEGLDMKLIFTRISIQKMIYECNS